MENQQQQQTGLCRAGCGFYGSAVTEGLCSKCFKDNIKRTQDTSTPRINQNSNTKLTISSNNAESASTSMNVSIDINTNSLINHSDKPSSANINILDKPILDQKLTENIPSTELLVTARNSSVSLNEPTGEIATTEVSNATKKPNRCHVCKTRVGLTGFVCRCGGMYCGQHRYDKAHDCSFDYKTMEREEIRKNNPVVVSDKIQRI